MKETKPSIASKPWNLHGPWRPTTDLYTADRLALYEVVERGFGCVRVARAAFGRVDPTKPDLVTSSLITDPKRITIHDPVGRSAEFQGAHVERGQYHRKHDQRGG